MAGRFYRGRGDYAGRLDTIAECHGTYQGVELAGVYVFDYKSSKDPKQYHPRGYPEWRLQTAAYRDAVSQEEREEPVTGNATIRLDKFTGIPEVFDASDSYTQDLVSFKALVTFYHSMYPEKLRKGVPSVTTILGILNKPALIQWAANCATDYVWRQTEEIMSLTRDELWDLLVRAKKNWRTVKDAAANIGTEVHKLIEDFLTSGTLPHTPTLSIPVENAWNAFLEFYDTVDFRVIEQEVKITGYI